LSEDFPVPGGLAAGSRVAGYRVEEPLGAGGMAVVYRAKDERLGRLVALKVLAPALAADGEFRRRFTAESRAAAAVDHPHIIPVYEAGQDNGALFIAMRLVTGGDLRGQLAQGGPLPPERAAQFLSPVASALDAAHRAGLVHRDVKPANVLVDADPGRPEHVYLSDFGISQGAASSGGRTGTGRYLGTPEYTSPEQVKGDPVDGRADQYALACVAWQLLTGSVPFQRDQGIAVLFAHLHEPLPPLDALRPGLPGAAGQVLARAMAKEPGERYASCGEFTDALRDALALPAYRPAASVRDPAAAGHPRTEVSAPPAHPATVSDWPTQDIAAPGQRLRPGPGPDGRPARRRRYVMITFAGTFLAAGTAISLLLVAPGASRPPAGPHGGTSAATPAASKKKTTESATSTASGKTAKPAATLANADSRGVRSVAFGPGTTLAAGDANGRIYLWDTATGKLTGHLTDPGSKGVNTVRFGPGGTSLAAADGNGSTYVWDIATRKITLTVTDPGGRGVSAVAFGPGTTLATGDENGRTYLWDDATGTLTSFMVAPTSPSRAVSSMAYGTEVEFGSDRILAAGDGAGVTILLDQARFGKLGVLLPGSVIDRPSKGVNAVVFGPGTTLSTGDENGKVYLWDTATETVAGTVTDPASKGVSSLASGPGNTLAAGDYNGSIYLWDTATEELAGTLTDPASKGVSSLASGSGGILAAGDYNGRIYLWRIRAIP
jgi:WD40 repeat protein